MPLINHCLQSIGHGSHIIITVAYTQISSIMKITMNYDGIKTILWLQCMLYDLVT